MKDHTPGSDFFAKVAGDMARMLAEHARTAVDRKVAAGLWRMAEAYQATAAKFGDGKTLDIGSPPIGPAA
jgi:hypothetical protein